MTVMIVMTRLVSGKESKSAVSTRFNTRSKDRFKWSIMMELMKVMKKLLQRSEINRGTRMEIGCNTKMKLTCFKHVMMNDTTSP